MASLLETAFSFPAIVFTVSTVFFMGFWIVTTVLGAGISSFGDIDLDFDTDVDAEIDLGADATESGAGALRGALEFLGLTGLPILLALNLLSLFGWATVMIAVTLMGGSGAISGGVGFLIGLAILVLGVVVGGLVTSRIGRKLASVFRPAHALRRHELVGKVCTVTTDKVNANFGQAEVRDPEGGSLLLQIRCPNPNELRAGSQALIFDLDDTAGVYTVSPDLGLPAD